MKIGENIVRWLRTSLHQSWMVVAGAVGVVAGVVLGVVLRVNYFASWWFVVLAGILFLVSLLKPKITFAVVALIGGMLLAFFRIAGELEGEAYVRQFFGENVVVAGEVSGDPETDEKGTKIKLVGLRFGAARDGPGGLSDGVAATGSIYVSLRKNEEIRRSDTVVLKGNLSEGFSTYAGYMYQPYVVEILRPEPGDAVLSVRDWFASRVKSQIPEEQANLGLSYLLGMKAGLSDELDENLRVVGLTHIVVASGAHLAILVEVAKKIFGKFSRFAGLSFSIIFIVLFMMMVGWTPSIMRAGVMTILGLACWYVGRKMSPMRIILLVAAGTLIVNPNFVMNMGWLLSFASYAGITVVGPSVTKWFFGEKKPGAIGSLVMTTISATIMTLPILLYYYGQVSLVSLLANLLILPTLPYAMGLVFGAGIVAGIPVIGGIVGFVATKVLEYHIAVVGIFGEMKQFLVKIEEGNPWVFLIYAVVVVAVIWRYLRIKKLRRVRVDMVDMRTNEN